jgi:rhamnosyltransferase
MKVLVVSGTPLDGSDPGRVSHVKRCRAVVEALSDSGHEIVVIAPGEIGARPRGADLRIGLLLSLELDAFEGGIALDGVMREVCPDVVVGLGMDAGAALSQVVFEAPLWVDFEADPFPDSARLRFEAGGRLGFRHRLLWALDRADAISCADAHVSTALKAVLAIRGRDLSPDGGVQPRLLESESQIATALVNWIAKPNRNELYPRILGMQEIRELVRASHSESELRAQASRPLRQLSRFLRSGRRRLGRVLGRSLDSAAGVLTTVGLAASSIRLVLRRLRSGACKPVRRDLEMPALKSLEARLGRRPRLLIVTPLRLAPPRHGGATRLLNLIKQLSERCEIHLLRFDQRGENRVERELLRGLCKVQYHHWVVPPGDPPSRLLLPAAAWVHLSEEAKWRIRQIVESEGIDVVQLETTELAQYRRSSGTASTILVEYDLAWRSLARRRRLQFSRRYAENRFQGVTLFGLMRQYHYEIAACDEVDEIHVMSDADARQLGCHLRDRGLRIRVVPNGVDSTAFSPENVGGGSGALFVANYENLPNRDALEWLVAEIWPRVRAVLPEAELTVAGAKAPPEVRAVGGRDGIRFVGEVEDLAALYHAHRALAVPLRAGSGTRLKILEGFAARIPVVSTTVGIEGINAEPGRHFRLADDAEAFAYALVDLLRHPQRANIATEAAAELVLRQYDWKQAAERNYAGVLELAARRNTRAAVEKLPAPCPQEAPKVDVAIVIPTRGGGALLERVLDAIALQRTRLSTEVVCVDSGSSSEEIGQIRGRGVRVVEIEPETFDHGLTRDFGAASTVSDVIVFLNQDAMPADEHWLERLVAPLLGPAPPAATQGAIHEFPTGDPEGARRFYWDSGGPRFYFTSESTGWITRHGGIGFSTVNCAIRRTVWSEVRFGWAPIMEDKKWQREIVARELRIASVDSAVVFHTHDYDLRALWRRCAAEGEGWRRLGERYSLGAAFADATRGSVWRDWRAGVRAGRLRRAAEILFPLARPLALWRGNSRAGREIR